MPFPVWFCGSCQRPILADLASLPVDPLVDVAPVATCPDCDATEIVPDPDVMDTWMTSSLTPQINDSWALCDFQPDSALAPMSLRAQAFEIIRTWLFYTLVQSEFHFNRVPWSTVMISGWGLNEQGKKIAKRDLEQSATVDGFNRYVPDHVIDRYGADALRLWATKARVGTDLRYNEKDIRAGRKFSVKLWNVGRFIQMNLGDFDSTVATRPSLSERTAVDRWLLSHLADAVAEVTAAFEDYDFMQAHLAASRFFWSIYCDRYIEMVKDRFIVVDEHSEADRCSARWTLWESYRVVLGLFAPFAPFVTEHMFQRFYQTHEPVKSLHVSTWPAVDAQWVSDRTAMDKMATVLDAVRALRAQHKLGNAARFATLLLDPRTAAAKDFAATIAEPLRVAARARHVVFEAADHDSGVEGLMVGMAV